MSNEFEVVVSGLQVELDRFKDAPARLDRILSQAVNRITVQSRTEAARRIRQQVAFPASYLNPSEGRLVVTGHATPANPVGVISARQRPTSLARFATTKLQPGKRGGITVVVRPGRAKFSNRMFALNLQGNIGLAIRLRQGETLENKKNAVAMSKAGRNSSVYILYGPSVDQVFKTVRTDMHGQILDQLTDEIFRLSEL